MQIGHKCAFYNLNFKLARLYISNKNHHTIKKYFIFY